MPYGRPPDELEPDGRTPHVTTTSPLALPAARKPPSTSSCGPVPDSTVGAPNPPPTSPCATQTRVGGVSGAGCHGASYEAHAITPRPASSSVTLTSDVKPYVPSTCGSPNAPPAGLQAAATRPS